MFKHCSILPRVCEMTAEIKAGHLWWVISQYPSSCDPVRWGKSAAGMKLRREGFERALFVQHTRSSRASQLVLFTKTSSPEMRVSQSVVWSSGAGSLPGVCRTEGSSPTGCSISSLSGCWNAVPSCDFCPGSFWGSWFQRGQKKCNISCREGILSVLWQAK